MGEKSPIVPILAGAGGAVVATVAAEKVGLSPNVAAWGTAAVGAATALGTKGVIRQVATGVGAAGACLGALSLFASARANAAAKHVDQHKKRQADEGYVTKQELNDALSKMADGTKQAHCDLLTALDDRIKQVAGVQPGPVTSPKPQPTPGGVPRMYSLYRGAGGEDEYMRNAYGDLDERNAEIFEERNAFGEDEYMRNAYGDLDERNAEIVDERNAYVDDERNAYVDEERNADFEERNAYADEERNAGEEYPAAA